MAMEQFEKWDEEICENCDEWKYRNKYRDLHCVSCTTLKKQGWKAALGMVLNNYPDDAIYEVIKKELGNENQT